MPKLRPRPPAAGDVCGEAGGTNTLGAQSPSLRSDRAMISSRLRVVCSMRHPRANARRPVTANTVIGKMR